MIAFAVGAVLAAAIAAAAYRARSLSFDGAVAAFVVGAIVFGTGGWRGAAVLLAFFVPSSILTRVGRARKRLLEDAHGTAPRNAWQVLANGGVATLCALLAARGSVAFAAAFAGAFAAASADTWGTEIGTLSKQSPRSILTMAPVRAGLSGGVTLLGSVASIAGAFVVALVAAAIGTAPLLPVAFGGIAGALLDSLLGASLQALRWCPACSVPCETVMHSCGEATILRRGARWIGNDAVNFGATLCGAAVAWLATR